jgi:hypothetical protein
VANLATLATTARTTATPPLLLSEEAAVRFLVSSVVNRGTSATIVQAAILPATANALVEVIPALSVVSQVTLPAAAQIKTIVSPLEGEIGTMPAEAEGTLASNVDNKVTLPTTVQSNKAELNDGGDRSHDYQSGGGGLSYFKKCCQPGHFESKVLEPANNFAEQP